MLFCIITATNVMLSYYFFEIKEDYFTSSEAIWLRSVLALPNGVQNTEKNWYYCYCFENQRKQCTSKAVFPVYF